MAILYEECADRLHMSPPEVDNSPLWKVAAALGRNRPEEDLREPWPDGAPDIRVVRRSYWLAKGERPPGRDVPIGEDEYAELLELAQTAKRQEDSPRARMARHR